MHVLLFGGTGRTGKLIAQCLLAAGHAVTAAGRRDPQIPGIPYRQVDLSDAEDVIKAAQGVDAVVSALASAKGNPVCSGVARALTGQDGLRFVTIGGAGVDMSGDQKGLSDRLIGWVMRRVVPEMLADRQAEFDILQQSRLRWTMLRPPRLTDKHAKGVVKISFDRPASAAISRADLAQAVVDTLTDDTLVSRAPFVAG